MKLVKFGKKRDQSSLTVKYSTFKFTLSRFVAKRAFILKTITNLPFINTRKTNTYVFTYFNVFSTYGTSCKKCVDATTFRTICGETKKTWKKVFGISEVELLKFDCVNPFFLQGQCKTQFDLCFLDISNFVSPGDHAGHTRKASRISKAAVDNCYKGVGNFYLS